MINEPEHITELLAAWSAGDEVVLDQLIPLVETELRRLAHYYMRRENPHHTLQTTALINEAYLRLAGGREMQWNDRAHFFAVAAQVMRRLLINYARDRQAHKRGGGLKRIELDTVRLITPEKSAELTALDDALEKLSSFDRTKSRIVELRYFGGLTIRETAEVMQIAEPTVSLHWRLARAWLKDEISKNLEIS